MRFFRPSRLVVASGLVAATLVAAPFAGVFPRGDAGQGSVDWRSALEAAGAEAATVEYFLKLDGVEGESTSAVSPGSIEVQSWSWGATNTGSQGDAGGGSGAGKVSFQDIHFTSRVNKASPQLFQATATGKHIKEAVLIGLRGGGDKPQEFLKIKMTDVLVSSYQTRGSSGDVPTDEVSLNFAKIEFSYTTLSRTGAAGSPVSGCFDLRENTAC